MRGYKLISFNQFSDMCNEKLFDQNEVAKCDKEIESVNCCPSNCYKWKKLKGAKSPDQNKQ